MESKVCCVIQGDIRTHFKTVIKWAIDRFDDVVVSTWKSERFKIDEQPGVHYVYNDKPSNPGFSNRNLLRFSTARGIDRAVSIGATHILKWRSDMICPKLNKKILLDEANHYDEASRLVTLGYRCLSTEPDIFSSVNDLFVFGTQKDVFDLWSDVGIDYSKDFNPPPGIGSELRKYYNEDHQIIPYWCSETELYCWYHHRLQKSSNEALTHQQIMKRKFKLLDIETYTIIWFGANNKLRPINSSPHLPWWSNAQWRSDKTIRLSPPGYINFRHLSNIEKWFIQFRQIFNQRCTLHNYCLRLIISNLFFKIKNQRKVR